MIFVGAVPRAAFVPHLPWATFSLPLWGGFYQAGLRPAVCPHGPRDWGRRFDGLTDGGKNGDGSAVPQSGTHRGRGLGGEMGKLRWALARVN